MNGTNWQVVKHGDQLPMMQGYALNMLAQKFPGAQLELGSYKDYAAYRITLQNGNQAVYLDFGDRLELLDSVSVARIACEKALA